MSYLFRPLLTVLVALVLTGCAAPLPRKVPDTVVDVVGAVTPAAVSTLRLLQRSSPGGGCAAIGFAIGGLKAIDEGIQEAGPNGYTLPAFSPEIDRCDFAIPDLGLTAEERGAIVAGIEAVPALLDAFLVPLGFYESDCVGANSAKGAITYVASAAVEFIGKDPAEVQTFQTEPYRVDLSMCTGGEVSVEGPPSVIVDHVASISGR